MKKTSLFKKFILLVVPLIIVTAMAIGLGMGLISQSAFQRTIKADYTVAAAEASRLIEYYLKNAFEETQAAASFVSSIRLDKWRTQMAITELRHIFPRFQYIALIDGNGYEAVDAWFNQDLFSHDGWDTFEKANEGKLAYSRTVILDKIPIMFIAAPVFHDGVQVGVIWARLDLKPVWDVVIQLKRDLNFGSNGHVYLVDQFDTLVASDEISRQFGQRFELPVERGTAQAPLLNLRQWQEEKHLNTYDPATLKSLLANRHNRPDFWISDIEGDKTIFLKSDITDISWTLYMVQPYDDAFYFLYRGFWTSMGLVVFIVFTGILLTWFTTKRFLRPMERLHLGVERAAQGNLSTPIEVETRDEVGELANHFNEMQTALKAYIARLVETTSDLNHAKNLAVLGTTASQINHQVSNFLNNLVFALSIIKMDNLSEASQASLDVIEENTKQIHKFTQRLLSFSKKEKLALELWEPEENLIRIVESFRVQAEKSDKALHFVSNGHIKPILVDAALIEQAISNLIQNALEASEAGNGVSVALKEDGDRIMIEIIDSGKGIPPEQIEDVFTPFFTTKGEKGTGLGLPLVRTAVEAHGGEIILENRNPKGVGATMWLPAAPPAFSRTPLADENEVRDNR